jgi:hypothetical protein
MLGVPFISVLGNFRARTMNPPHSLPIQAGLDEKTMTRVLQRSDSEVATRLRRSIRYLNVIFGPEASQLFEPF